MQNVTNCDVQIKMVLQSIADADLSSTARLVAVLEAFGITDRSEVEALTASKSSTIREAVRALKIQRQKFISAGIPAPEIQRTAGIPSLSAGNPAAAPEIQRQKSSDLAHADIASHANKESSSKILLVKEEASKLAAPDLSEEMISNIAKWANMPEANSAQWLASTIATFGQTATVESYHKMMSDKLQGAVVAKPISTWSKIAKRMKDEAEAVVKTGSERIAPWKQEKIDGTREALKIAAEMGYA